MAKAGLNDCIERATMNMYNKQYLDKTFDFYGFNLRLNITDKIKIMQSKIFKA